MSERVTRRRLIDAEYHSHLLLRELHALEAEAAPYNMRVTEMLSQLREIDTDLTAWRMDRDSDPDEEPAEERRAAMSEREDWTDHDASVAFDAAWEDDDPINDGLKPCLACAATGTLESFDAEGVNLAGVLCPVCNGQGYVPVRPAGSVE